MTPAANSDLSREIDLADLIRTLWASKILIVVVTAIVTAAAAGYAFLTPPIYQASVQTLPPTTSDLASYNAASQLTGEAISHTVAGTAPGISPITTEAAYQIFLRYLDSNTVRQRFFEAHYLPAQADNETESDKQSAWNRLNRQLTIQLPARANESVANVTVEDQDPKRAALWANTYVELAIAAGNEDLSSRLASEVEIRQRGLEAQINAIRQVAQQVKENQAERLRNALNIAENLGLETPADSTPLITIHTQDPGSDNNDSLLYLRGASALRSEIQQLEERSDEDAYISELPDLLKKQTLIGSINLEPDNLAVATIDRAAIAPETPVSPNKPLILLLGVLLGGILGVSLALLRQLRL